MLLDDIISLLSNENASLSDALLKTKILLHQIGEKELSAWVANELNGYPNNSDVPPYRILPSHVMANLSNPVSRYTRHPIPVGHLNEKFRESLVRSRMPQSLSVLERLAKQDSVERPIPMEFNHELGKKLGNSFSIERAWCEIAGHDINGILLQIRSRLLDFLLGLKDNIGESGTGSELREKSNSMDTKSMFNNAIFGAGSNFMIVVGDRSSVNATQNISGNELADGVRKLVAQAEQHLPTLPEASNAALMELREAANAEIPDVGRLRRGLESLKRIMEGAAGNLVASGVLASIAELLSHPAH